MFKPHARRRAFSHPNLELLVMDKNRESPKQQHKQPPMDERPQSQPGRESQMREKPDHGEESYKGTGKLTGKCALITGADSGIGRAVAIAFAREGADVAIAYLNEHDDAKETERLVRAAGRRAVSIAGDLAEPEACRTAVRRSVAELGRLDIIVNNAAHQGKAVERFEEITPERWERTFRVNITAMFYIVREALEHLQPGGAIINTASIQAYKPSAAILDYATTKGAIVAFTKGLAQELVNTRGVRVNCVAPGPVWTPIIPQSFEGEKLTEFGKQSPMQRPAQPAELAPAYVFLASQDSSYVNGEVLGVTGGTPLG
jgi:NAD(P)-dependent dehydrogenase (short-subunit alcohol dehydrogenase family)